MKKYMSRIISCVILVTDALWVGFFTNEISFALVTIPTISLLVLFSMHYNKSQIKSTPIEQADEWSRTILLQNFNCVLNSAKKQEKKKNINLKLYIVDNGELNAYATNNSIFIERYLLTVYHDNQDAIKGILAHELSHTLNKDYFLKTILDINKFLLIFICTSFPMGSLFIPIFVAALFLTISGSKFSSTIYNLTEKIFMVILTLVSKFFHYLYSIITSKIFKCQEKIADEYATTLGFGSGLKSFFKDIISMMGTEISIEEILFSDHPDNLQRIHLIDKKIQKMNDAKLLEEKEGMTV